MLLLKALKDCFTCSPRPSSRRRRMRHEIRSAEIELLESRQLLSSVTAVLDFDGEYLDRTQMAEGGWSGYGTKSVSSFHSLFTDARPELDIDRSGSVGRADAGIAISRIAHRIRQDFSPYNVNIIEGDQDTHRSKLTDSHAGDVIALVTGGFDVMVGGSYGVAPWVDADNSRDEIVWTFGKTIANAYSASDPLYIDKFVNHMARTISHEIGHAFGLYHVTSAPDGSSGAVQDAATHHVMSSPGLRDMTRDFNFPNLSFNTTGGVQNAHQTLLRNVGSSTNPWAAVLTPGTLTMRGANTVDQAYVLSGSHSSDWTVTVNSYGHRLSGTLDPSASPHIHSMNPFSTAVTRITYVGWRGDDTLLVSPSVTATVFAYGGAGNDELHGGGGTNYLYGFGGDDRLYGRDGTDFLYGGGGNDYLYGRGGRDYLYGSSGNDYLNGGAGNDYVRGQGGHDYVIGSSGNDRLYGDDGDDYLYAGYGDDYLSGGDGNDYLSGHVGRDILSGGSGNDRLYGGDGADRLYGGSGNDVLMGDAGHDRLYGGQGRDRLYGGDGDDYLDGGFDSLTTNFLDGGSGDDHFVIHYYRRAGYWYFDFVNDYGDGDDSRSWVYHEV